METAHIYFAAMILTMGPLVVVHVMCWRLVWTYPDIMPDHTQRRWYTWAESAMAAACVAMLWYMWMLLPWMVSICATDSMLGALAHVPWIVATSCVLYAKTAHMMRLIGQVQRL